LEQRPVCDHLQTRVALEGAGADRRLIGAKAPIGIETGRERLELRLEIGVCETSDRRLAMMPISRSSEPSERRQTALVAFFTAGILPRVRSRGRYAVLRLGRGPKEQALRFSRD
jgi:hypothetical protein